MFHKRYIVNILDKDTILSLNKYSKDITSSFIKLDEKPVERIKLKKIKPSSIKIKKGDVFVLNPIGNLYFYGIVLTADMPNEGMENLVLIFKDNTTEFGKWDFKQNFNVDNMLVEILFVNNDFWSEGYFYNIGINIEIPNSFDYGFIHLTEYTFGFISSDEKITNEYFEPIDHKPKVVAEYLDYTPLTLGYRINTEIIIDQSYLEGVVLDETEEEPPIEETHYIDIEEIEINKQEHIQLSFYVGNDKPFSLIDKVEEINEVAYLNAYNWSVLLEFYSKQNNLNIFENTISDHEASLYNISFVKDDNGGKQANKLKEIIENFVENEEILLDYIKNYGDEIEWD